MTRRDAFTIAAAVVAGGLWGLAITQAGHRLQVPLVGEGRWLAAAWLFAAAARRPAAAVISALAFVLALQGSLDVLPWAGVEREVRQAGFGAGSAGVIAGGLDGTEFVWPRTADLVAGAAGVVPVALAVVALAVAATIVRTPRAVGAAVALALVPVAIAWSGAHLSDDWIVHPREIAVIR